MKRIAVYCGSSLGEAHVYEKEAGLLGEWLTQNQYDLVFGGGQVGLMGVVADAVLRGQGRAIGVMPDFLQDGERAHNGLTEFYTVSSMHERKLKMIELSDAFIALPGGPGTLEEISEVYSWRRIGQHRKPCVFYNINGFYDPLAVFFSQMVSQGFLSEADYHKVLFSDSLETIHDFIRRQWEMNGYFK